MIPNLKNKLRHLSEETAPAPVLQAEAVQTMQQKCETHIHRYVWNDPVFGERLSSCRDITASEIAGVCRTDMDGDFELEQMVFVDTETTGLYGSGIMAFLVGFGYFDADGFVVEQLFMQDYDREPHMLETLCDRLARFRYIVTYNGKCFDAPLLESRMVVNRIRAPLSRMIPVDLLFPARRLWKNRLENCSLGTLEEAVLSIARELDIPGREIPATYFNFLRNGCLDDMERVIAHNRQDICSMVLLLEKMARIWRNPCAHADLRVVSACGMELLRQGNEDRAMDCFRHAVSEPQAKRELSLLHKRRGETEEAMALWSDMQLRGEGGTFPYVEAAKCMEHLLKDPDGALDAVERCLMRMRSLGFSSHPDTVLLQRRRDRLIEKSKQKPTSPIRGG